ncbi:aldehyde dehydrogenase family protein [Candidatus Gracilibacteria bacterium]|nr:aldehyde dehydrogenase family protein [Candidatus Gracilibacteria bacterium]
MKKLQSINTYSGEVLAEYETLSDAEITQKIELAHKAFQSWRETSFAERKELFHRLADITEERIDELARLQTLEMGMLIGPSRKGLEGTVKLMRWFADNVETYLGAEEFELNGTSGKYLYDPLGVIYGIGPWNFPFNQVLRAAVPNIIAGNTQVYKHASNVPQCAAAIEQLFLDAGFPEGVYQNIFISASQSELILAHKYVAGVNLTGSEGAGSAIGALAGKYLKPSVLELGGNDAFVLASHSDTKKMAREAVNCRVSFGGQKCNSSKRFIVLAEHYDEFVGEMTAYMKSLKLGDPLDETTTLPPLARTDLVQEVHTQVQKTISEGARLMCGGEIFGERGQFYTGTVLADVTSEMTSYREEIFGPVASIIKSSSIEESVKIANDSDFGLSAVVYGDDISECRAIAEKLEGGMIFINAPAGSQPHLPFGGVKKSGYGKENGPEGLRAFTNKKVIVY